MPKKSTACGIHAVQLRSPITVLRQFRRVPNCRKNRKLSCPQSNVVSENSNFLILYGTVSGFRKSLRFSCLNPLVTPKKSTACGITINSGFEFFTRNAVRHSHIALVVAFPVFPCNHRNLVLLHANQPDLFQVCVPFATSPCEHERPLAALPK